MTVEQIKSELMPILKEKEACNDSITKLNKCETYTDLWLCGIHYMTWAIENGIDVIQYLDILLKNDMDVNIQDIWGKTALIYASFYGRLEVVKYLVEDGKADVNIKTNTGWTALMLASKFGRLDIVKYLKSIGTEK
jgi:ankyrin repeat protein